MIWSSEDIARLKAAIASGQLSWRHGDRQMTYQSVSEMTAALDRMLADNAAAQANAGPRRATSRYAFTTGRGH